MNNSYITIIKEKRTALSRKRIPLNQNGCTANFRIGVPFEQNLQYAPCTNKMVFLFNRLTFFIISNCITSITPLYNKKVSVPKPPNIHHILETLHYYKTHFLQESPAIVFYSETWYLSLFSDPLVLSS